MIYTPLTKKCMIIAYEAHAVQTDIGGTPYVYHPFHVAEQMKTEYEVCAALLHDVLEDTDMTADDLLAEGVPEDVVEALKLLVHEKGTPYLEYVSALKPNAIARAVKLADLDHNTDLSRLGKVTERDIKRAAKYRKAVALLEEDD